MPLCCCGCGTVVVWCAEIAVEYPGLCTAGLGASYSGVLQIAKQILWQVLALYSHSLTDLCMTLLGYLVTRKGVTRLIYYYVTAI
jgi:hypothetical protein